MKSYYMIRMPASVQPAIADVSLVGHAYMINRINVPSRFRGQGYGSKLLQMIIDDADLENQILILTVAPSGELDTDELIAWYERHGFAMIDRASMLMRRRRASTRSFEEIYNRPKSLCH